MKFTNYKKLLLGLLIFFTAVFLFFAFLPKSPSIASSVMYNLEKGSGFSNVANDLEKQGIIRSSLFFKFYALFSGKYSKLQAGKYELSSSMSIAEIIKKFASGDVVKNKITIIEGWKIKDIAEYLEGETIYSKEDFLEAIKIDYSKDFPFLTERPKGLDLEGYIFPDTYYLAEGALAEELIKIALSNFDKKLSPELRQEILRQKKSVFKIITMASMLEKEVKSLEDKKIVSGILWKRIEAGIPLQVDATVNYVTGKHDIKVAVGDTKIDSPYNTYKYYGLPRGPISNPGLDSILAAIYPITTDYWYYLSADENGMTIFSKTLDDHNTARAKYFK